MAEPEKILVKHGGYRKLKSFQVAQLVYDVTVRFCQRYIDPYSRTKDQMVQAARSGMANIAEGSQASGTSKKTELKLTNVARASLEELRLDYEDYLRQRGLPVFEAEDPVLKRFKARKCKTIAEVSEWIQQERKQIPDGQGSTPLSKDPDGFAADNGNPGKPFSSAELAANAALSLLNLVCYLLGRQIATQAEAFEQEGGFTERLHRVRKQRPGKT
jgi:four helix bundle suffix protein